MAGRHTGCHLPRFICLRLQYPNNLGCSVTKGKLQRLLDKLRTVSPLIEINMSMVHSLCDRLYKSVAIVPEDISLVLSKLYTMLYAKGEL